MMLKGNPQLANLQKQGCSSYDKLQQLFAPSTTTGNLQISSNTPALNSDEEHVMEEEIANESVPTHLDNDCYTLNLESVSQTVEDTEVKDQTQDASGKGKKVSKKADRISDTTVALKEYIAMTRERFSGKQGKSNGTSEQFAQSVVGGDPCSLGKAIELLNKYEDLRNKTYVKT